ncbi:MAG: DUF58 domain-containing protein [Planctomycetes bacterium]|jgi:uncharacterized protein (DUF58 family)|nr:DUF58 domain-containing protein [Planctomycetota bacterium]
MNDRVDAERAARGRSDDLPGLLAHVEPLAARKFVIAIRRLANDLTYGLDGSRFLGSGIDYVQSRLYQHGDSVKSIDWRVTARSTKVHVKEYEAQRRIPAWFLIDTSASMVVSSTARSKYELALHCAGGLALACLDRTSPVGVIGCGEREVRVPPSLAKDQVLQWLLALRRHAFDDRTALVRRIAELRPTLTARSIVVVCSDLHEPGAVHAVALLAQQHEVAVLQFQDPAELALPGSGFVRAQEAESGRAFVNHGRRRLLDQATIEAELRRGGVDHLLIRTDQPFVHRLRHFFRARGLGRGAR